MKQRQELVIPLNSALSRQWRALCDGCNAAAAGLTKTGDIAMFPAYAYHLTEADRDVERAFSEARKKTSADVNHDFSPRQGALCHVLSWFE